MKKDIQPELNNVCFTDASTKTDILMRSTMKSKEKKVIDGVEYYVVNVQTSSDSHSFFTGEQKHLDAAGRIDKFNKKFGSKK